MHKSLLSPLLKQWRLQLSESEGRFGATPNVRGKVKCV